MGKTSIKTKLDTLLEWEGGQRLFNFAYSIGAAIVILGALFKILHLPGGNTLLCVGMGTEVLMFVITAFDRPPKDFNPEELMSAAGDGKYAVRGRSADTSYTTGVSDGVVAPAELSAVTCEYLAQMSAIAEQMKVLKETTESLNSVSAVLLDSYRAVIENSESIAANSQGYITQMDNLNRNLGGLNTIYEIQLKSVSSQLDAIERINCGIKDIRDMYEKSATASERHCEESEKMVRYMQQLNKIYEKTIDKTWQNQ
ncbi:MAG: gliding motility protein GldL [Duncaniella sp.]|nr:gliding motility protein GldL [Duncaniella sp.]MDE7146309.1 gliding motility protein GldL [Duncaniella sp.]